MEKDTISKEEFLADVRAEVEALKRHAFKTEIKRLNLSFFNPSSMYNCIYGQMTGSCKNNRAKKLMGLACKRVAHHGAEKYEKAKFNKVSKYINGEYKAQMWLPNSGRNFDYLSLLETYILLKGAKPENIIKYLKGVVDELELPLL